MAPGPEVASLLAGIRPAELTAYGRLGFVRAHQRLVSWTESLVQPVLVDHVGLVDQAAHLTNTAQHDRHLVQQARLAEVATTLRISESTARNRLETARMLVGHLPLTLGALRTGHLSPMHVRVLLEAVAGVADDCLAAVEERVVPGCVARGGAGTPSSFGRSCRGAVVAVDAQAGARRHRRAGSLRGIRTYPMRDGMAALEVTSTAADVDVILQALTALAGPRDSDDPRSLDNRRVDALVALCLGRGAPADPTEQPPPAIRPDVCANVVVDLPTLLGLADNPAELPGYGPVPAGVAREWLADATCWRRLVVDPLTGHLLDHGPVVRTPPPRLRRFVVARDQTCTFPGCERRAQSCDLDHVQPWRGGGSGGRTAAGNLQPLCRRHHNLKTAGVWRVVANHPDRVVWASPTGRLLTRYRPRIGPPRRTEPQRWHGRRSTLVSPRTVVPQGFSASTVSRT
jgi:hypothetical protein